MSACQIDTEWKRCCCNCKHQLKIMKHPWNKIVGNGHMSDIMGYGCTAAINLISNMEDRKIIFTESEHGLCEFWQ